VSDQVNHLDLDDLLYLGSGCDHLFCQAGRPLHRQVRELQELARLWTSDVLDVDVVTDWAKNLNLNSICESADHFDRCSDVSFVC
jgi:hypothetical protein